jgi:beta-1,4-galactosyltransferase 1
LTKTLAATKVPPALTLSQQEDGPQKIAADSSVNKTAPPTETSFHAANPALCSDMPQTLDGRVAVNENFQPNLDKLRKENTLLQEGGCYKPSDCTSTSKIAILIPFRERQEHLQIFLYYMHPMLQRQQTNYCIYVIEQDGKDLFNRGMLFNVGVKEALKDKDYDCFALHDVDLIAENPRNSYHCPAKALHLSALIHRVQYEWRPYPSNFGGAAIVRRDHFEKINGFSNLFWGWGGEDDEISAR